MKRCCARWRRMRRDSMNRSSPRKKGRDEGGGVRDEPRYVSRRAGEKLLAAAQVDLHRRLRRMARKISPTLAMKSRTEIRWIWGAAVNVLYEEFSQVWQGRIESLPTRMVLVRPSEDRPHGSDRRGGDA